MFWIAPLKCEHKNSHVVIAVRNEKNWNLYGKDLPQDTLSCRYGKLRSKRSIIFTQQKQLIKHIAFIYVYEKLSIGSVCKPSEWI